MELADLTNLGEKQTTTLKHHRSFFINFNTFIYLQQENTESNTTIALLPHFGTSIQTQHKSASYASAVSNYVSSSGLDQIINHHCNMYSKNNDDSQSYETPQKKVVPNILVIQYPPQPHHDLPQWLHLENNTYVFKWKGKVPMQHNVLNQEHSSKF